MASCASSTAVGADVVEWVARLESEAGAELEEIEVVAMHVAGRAEGS